MADYVVAGVARAGLAGVAFGAIARYVMAESGRVAVLGGIVFGLAMIWPAVRAERKKREAQRAVGGQPATGDWRAGQQLVERPTITCPSCGFQNPPASRWCRDCRTDLPAQ